MLTIRQVIHTHRPMSDGKCFGCYLETEFWSPDHVLEVLEANGHNTTTNIPQNRV